MHKVIENVQLSNDNETRELFQYLKENGADFNAKDNNGNTPLHYAVNNHLSNGVIAMLIEEFGAIPERVNKAGKSAVDLARSKPLRIMSSEGRPEKLLPDFESALHAAIEKRDVNALSKQLDQNPSREKLFEQRDKKTPLERIEDLINENAGSFFLLRWWKNHTLIKMQMLYLGHCRTRDDSNAISVAKITKNTLSAELVNLLEEDMQFITTPSSATQDNGETTANTKLTPPQNRPEPPAKNPSPLPESSTVKTSDAELWPRQQRDPSSVTLSSAPGSPRNNSEDTAGDLEKQQSEHQSEKPGASRSDPS